RAPEFMQLTVDPRQPVVPGEELDFRDEVMAQIYDAGDPAPKRKLVFRIETSDTGVTKGSQLIKEYREITGWRHVGSITFNEAVASFNGDHVLHFNHPRWRGPETPAPALAIAESSSARHLRAFPCLGSPCPRLWRVRALARQGSSSSWPSQTHCGRCAAPSLRRRCAPFAPWWCCTTRKQLFAKPWLKRQSG